MRSAVVIACAVVVAACPSPPPQKVCTARVVVHQPNPKPLADAGDEAHVTITKDAAPVFDAVVDLAGRGQAGGDVVAVAPSAAVPIGTGFELRVEVFDSVNDNTIVAIGRSKFACAAAGDVEVPLYLGAANAFAPTASPPIDLFGARAALLPDGRVLVVHDGATAFLVFDPANDTWCADCVGGSAQELSGEFALATLASGAVVVLGLIDGGVRRIDDGVVTLIGTLPSTARAAVVVAVDERVLVAGGFDDAQNVVATAYFVDGATGAIDDAIEPMNHARIDASAIRTPSGAVLVVGGGAGDGSDLDSVEQLDVDTGTWNTTGDTFACADTGENLCAKRRVAALSILDDGNVLITGGLVTPLDGSPDPPPDSEVFLVDQDRVLPATSTTIVLPNESDFTGVRATTITCATPPCPALVAGVSPHRLFTIAASPPNPGDDVYGGTYVDATNVAASPTDVADVVPLDDGSVLVLAPQPARFTFCQTSATSGLRCPDL